VHCVSTVSKDTGDEVTDLRQFALSYENFLPCNFIDNSINVGPGHISRRQQVSLLWINSTVTSDHSTRTLFCVKWI